MLRGESFLGLIGVWIPLIITAVGLFLFDDRLRAHCAVVRDGRGLFIYGESIEPLFYRG